MKLGGSLLDLPDLEIRLERWCRQQTHAANVVIVGGGRLVEALRHYDQISPLPAERMHWLAIQAMGIATRLAAARLDLNVTVSWSELKKVCGDHGESAGNHLTLFDAREFLNDWEPKLPGATLPAAWSVTSDSIAARVATALDAQELVLLKSVEQPTVALSEWADHDYVDAEFASLASSLPVVRGVNLRTFEQPIA